MQRQWIYPTNNEKHISIALGKKKRLQSGLNFESRILNTGNKLVGSQMKFFSRLSSAFKGGKKHFVARHSRSLLKCNQLLLNPRSISLAPGNASINSRQGTESKCSNAKKKRKKWGQCESAKKKRKTTKTKYGIISISSCIWIIHPCGIQCKSNTGCRDVSSISSKSTQRAFLLDNLCKQQTKLTVQIFMQGCSKIN